MAGIFEARAVAGTVALCAEKRSVAVGKRVYKDVGEKCFIGITMAAAAQGRHFGAQVAGVANVADKLTTGSYGTKPGYGCSFRTALHGTIVGHHSLLLHPVGAEAPLLLAVAQQLAQQQQQLQQQLQPLPLAAAQQQQQQLLQQQEAAAQQQQAPATGITLVQHAPPEVQLAQQQQQGPVQIIFSSEPSNEEEADLRANQNTGAMFGGGAPSPTRRRRGRAKMNPL
jgi:hypothetical protein